MDSRELPQSESIIAINDTDTETTPLVSTPHNRCTLIAKRATQATLGIVGLGAGILYIGPAQECAQLDGCGKWLTDLASKQVAVGVYTSGGADFALINMYMSAHSIDKLIDFIGRQPSMPRKVGMSILVMSFTATQDLALLLASLGTSTATWQTILTVTGGLPGSLYGAIGMMDDELPRLLAQANDLRRRMSAYIHTACSPHDAVTQSYFARLHYYRELQHTFLTRLTERSNFIESMAATLDVNPNTHPLHFIFGGAVTPSPSSWFSSGMTLFGKITGMGIGGLISVGFAKNSFHILENYVSNLPLRIISTIFLNAASVYGNIKMTMNGIGGFLGALSDVLRGQPIRSATFQMRPKLTLLALGLTLSAASFSYAVADVIYTNEFPNNDNKTRNAMRIANIVGMNLYHLCGLFEFYKLALSILSPDEKIKFITLVEKEIERLKHMSLDEFQTFVDDNTHELNELLQLTPYNHANDIESQDEREEIPEDALLINHHYGM